MLPYKIAVVLAFICVSVSLAHLVFYARSRAFVMHRYWARMTLFAAIIATILTELTVRVAGGSHAEALLWIHLAVAAPFLSFLIALQWFNGFRIPAMHKIFAWACLVGFFGTLATGSVLLYRL